MGELLEIELGLMTRVGSILTEYSAQMLQSLRTISTEVIELMLPFLNFPVSF